MRFVQGCIAPNGSGLRSLHATCVAAKTGRLATAMHQELRARGDGGHKCICNVSKIARMQRWRSHAQLRCIKPARKQRQSDAAGIAATTVAPAFATRRELRRSQRRRSQLQLRRIRNYAHRGGDGHSYISDALEIARIALRGHSNHAHGGNTLEHTV